MAAGETKLQRMRELTERLNAAADAYYNGRGELMTDYEWDAGFDELKRLEEETGEVLPDSPTQRVSEDDVAGRKEPHEFPALSLAKTKKLPDLVRWAEGRPVWVSWKLDGLTLVVTYDSGKLDRVVTRGNGHIGTNITHLAGAIAGIPAQIAYGGHLVIRGECVISYADFEQFLMESDEDYANPRNLASGSLTLKDPEEVKHRRLRWIPFTLVHTDEEIVSWGMRMDRLKELGFIPVESERVDVPDEEHLSAVIGRWSGRVTSRACPWPVDGLVIGYDDTAYAATGSVTGHHATRAGYAFKWQDEAAETTLEHIEWSCAAGCITPVAVFAPVELEGTTVRRASLCNVSECRRLGIGGPGTALAVIKANKIIPKVIRVDKAAGELTIPDTCPVCGAAAAVARTPGGTEVLRCGNRACAAKQLRKFTRFVSREGVNIDGVSEQTIDRFVNAGWIRTYADFFRLDAHMDEIRAMDGFGGKSAANLSAAIARARTVDAAHLLYALNIPLIGQDVARRLLGAMKLEDLLETARTADNEDVFAAVDGIGPEKSAALVCWMRDAENAKACADLLAELTVTQAEPVRTGDRCAGLTFVVTGDVTHWKNRNALKAYIESEGGRVAGSVSGSTAFLINNDADSPSAKNQKAHQLGIPILTEDAFIARFGGGNG